LKLEFLEFLNVFQEYEKLERDKGLRGWEKSRSLTDTNVNITNRRRESVPKILSFSTD